MQHNTGISVNRNISSRCIDVIYLGRILFLTVCLSFILNNDVSGQQIHDEVIILANDTVVVLKKRGTSLQISVTIQNRTNADTLVIKNIGGLIYPGLVYFVPDSLLYEKECDKSRLDFRIEDISGEIIQPQFLNTEKYFNEPNFDFDKSKEKSPLKNGFLKKKQINKCVNRNNFFLSRDTVLIVCPYLAGYYLSKGTYFLYIYYCNSDDTTYSLNYESSLIQTVPSVDRVAKKVFIGQFSTEAIKLVVK